MNFNKFTLEEVLKNQKDVAREALVAPIRAAQYKLDVGVVTHLMLWGFLLFMMIVLVVYWEVRVWTPYVIVGLFLAGSYTTFRLGGASGLRAGLDQCIGLVDAILEHLE